MGKGTDSVEESRQRKTVESMADGSGNAHGAVSEA